MSTYVHCLDAIENSTNPEIQKLTDKFLKDYLKLIENAVFISYFQIWKQHFPLELSNFKFVDYFVSHAKDLIEKDELDHEEQLMLSVKTTKKSIHTFIETNEVKGIFLDGYGIDTSLLYRSRLDLNCFIYLESLPKWVENHHIKGRDCFEEFEKFNNKVKNGPNNKSFVIMTHRDTFERNCRSDPNYLTRFGNFEEPTQVYKFIQDHIQSFEHFKVGTTVYFVNLVDIREVERMMSDIFSKVDIAIKPSDRYRDLIPYMTKTIRSTEINGEFHQNLCHQTNSTDLSFNFTKPTF